MDVAIVGIGIHPFGRHEGKTAVDMGADASRLALTDAGAAWSDMQFAVGAALGFAGSGGGATPDTMVNQMGLTGLQFINVVNGCATAGSALLTACNAIEAGQYDLGLVVGCDKHPRGAFDADPAVLGLEKWYGDVGMMLTTQFFAMKINRYMHDFGITSSTLAKVAAKNLRNGSLNPNAWRRQPMTEEEILNAPMLNYPLTQYMFCSPDEGAAAVVVCKGSDAYKYTDKPVFVQAITVRSRRFGSFEVMAPWIADERAPSPVVDAASACFEKAGIGPSDIDVAQMQDSEAGAEVMHMAENGFCKDGEQEDLIHRGETEIGGSMPINTDGGLIANGEPIGASGLRQTYEICLQLRGEAGPRQVPNDPRVGFTQVYGAPGIGACSVLSR